MTNSSLHIFKIFANYLKICIWIFVYHFSNSVLTPSHICQSAVPLGALFREGRTIVCFYLGNFLAFPTRADSEEGKNKSFSPFSSSIDQRGWRRGFIVSSSLEGGTGRGGRCVNATKKWFSRRYSSALGWEFWEEEENVSIFLEEQWKHFLSVITLPSSSSASYPREGGSRNLFSSQHFSVFLLLCLCFVISFICKT